MPTYIGTTGADSPGTDNTNTEIYGLGGNDTFYSSVANVVYIYGGNGNDSIDRDDSAIGGGAELYGDDGNDTIDGGSQGDEIYGGDDNDLLAGWHGDDYLEGGKGSDAVFGQDGEDTLYGGEGGDLLNGGDNADILYGGDGDDSNTQNFSAGVANGNYVGGLYGGNGDDYLDGGAGNDYLDGGSGVDDMVGGFGNDTFIVNEAADYIAESVGQGALDWVRTHAGYTLGTGVEVERLSAFNDASNVNFNLFGNEFAQEIWGNDGKNRINGLGGADVIKGFGGNDTFVYSSSAYSGVGANADIIQDFEDYGDDDTLDLSGFAGNLTWLGTGAIGGLNQVRIEQVGSHVLVQINAYGDVNPDVEILLGNTSLANVTSSDFLL
jgi:Ca2+-binding RTX toxin-like protein